MAEKSKPEQYSAYISSHILPFIDFYKLQESYDTDMIYAKGILTRLHEAMITVYGSERLNEQDSDSGFVVVPGVLHGRDSKKLCIALLELDLSSSGEHWGSDFLCKYGVISQDGNSAVSSNGSILKSEIKEITSAYIPYDYCYTATIPCDIHIDQWRLPEAIKSVLEDFHNHRADLLFESEELQGDNELMLAESNRDAVRQNLSDRIDGNLDNMVTELQRDMTEAYKPGQAIRIAQEMLDVGAAHEFLSERCASFSAQEAEHLLQFENPHALFTERWEAVAGGAKSAEDVARDILAGINNVQDQIKGAAPVAQQSATAASERDAVPQDDLLAQIAKKHCRVETLETRKSDSLDFHDVSVWGLKAALEEAYTAGMTRQIVQTKGAVRDEVALTPDTANEVAGKQSVIDRIREAAKTPMEQRRDKPARDKSEPEH